MDSHTDAASASGRSFGSRSYAKDRGIEL